MHKTDVAWLAGLLEGEGCFGVRKNAVGGAVTPFVQLQMTDQDIVERFVVLTSAAPMRSRELPSGKTAWSAGVTCRKAVAVMAAVLPMMGQRRSAKIKDAIARWSTRHTNVGSDHHAAILTEIKVEEIRRLAAAGMPQDQLAGRYGVARRTIRSVVGRYTWKHVHAD
jgi:hypothetical protein